MSNISMAALGFIAGIFGDMKLLWPNLTTNDFGKAGVAICEGQNMSERPSYQ